MARDGDALSASDAHVVAMAIESLWRGFIVVWNAAQRPNLRRRARLGRSMAAPVPTRDDIQPVANENLDRFLTGTVTVLPILALGIVAWQVWSSLLGWSDVIVFAIMYIATGLGVTVGFHRLFTHRSFKTTKAVRGILAALGSAAIEGPVISWVADHRKHHA